MSKHTPKPERKCGGMPAAERRRAIGNLLALNLDGCSVDMLAADLLHVHSLRAPSSTSIRKTLREMVDAGDVVLHPGRTGWYRLATETDRKRREARRRKARLHDAAPDMLEALRRISEWMDSEWDWITQGGRDPEAIGLKPHRAAVRAAIAKAEGRS